MARNSSPAISIVIPVYNGEIFLLRTLESLGRQSFKDFEVICVNDGSTDGSLAVLEEFACSDSRFKVLTKLNGGDATKAIIHGLNYATGYYFMYSSQDDLYSEDLLEKGFFRGEECGADAIVPDMEFYCDNIDSSRPTQSIRGVAGDRSRVLTGREAFVLSLDWTIHGFVLWKIDVVRKVGFATYGLSSDEYSSRMFFFHSEKVVFSSGIFYYRQDNPNAITKKWNTNQLDFIETCRRLNSFAVQHNMSSAQINVTQRLMLTHLIRVQLVFNRNRRALNQTEVLEFDKKMKSVYLQNIDEIRSLNSNGFIENIKKICCSNYFSFRIFVRLLQLISRKLR